MTLVAALGLERARLVALCGAGGKTSLMFALAMEMAAAGARVLVTTTTHLALDQTQGGWPAQQADDAAELAAATALPLIGYRAVDAARGKVVGFAPEALDRLAADGRFDRILVEADGAARRPLKAPAAHEPVIPAASEAVVMVAGLSGLGRPLDEATVFRAALWADRTGLALGDTVTPRSLALMIAAAEGLARAAPASARRLLWLNQADDGDRLAAARAVLDHLAGQRAAPERAVVGRLRPRPEVLEVRRFAVEAKPTA